MQSVLPVHSTDFIREQYLHKTLNSPSYSQFLRNSHISGISESEQLFFRRFVSRFVPNIARVHFHGTYSLEELFLEAATENMTLRDIFIACGAAFVAGKSECSEQAMQTYEVAIDKFVEQMRVGHVVGFEDWFFVAVQVLQTLCLRDNFGTLNATRCAAHLGAASRIITMRMLELDREYSALQKAMIENFVFNYSITIFYCDHTKLKELVPSPFDFFDSVQDLSCILPGDLPHAGHISMRAFEIAAKCSWLCRLLLPLTQQQVLIHQLLLDRAKSLIHHLDYPTASPMTLAAAQTTAVARAMLCLLMILLTGMLDREAPLEQFDEMLTAYTVDVNNVLYKNIVFPIWLLNIAACATEDPYKREIFVNRLDYLYRILNSRISMQVLAHLRGLWEIYTGREPFYLLFDTHAMDQVCM